ncbi:hypothetical protein G6F68_012172 [Rhizopus microsporus]|nr:hypothetical protein G6F68_012172 [Rhizopus microsporus]
MVDDKDRDVYSNKDKSKEHDAGPCDRFRVFGEADEQAVLYQCAPLALVVLFLLFLILVFTGPIEFFTKRATIKVSRLWQDQGWPGKALEWQVNRYALIDQDGLIVICTG